ncbi:acetyl-CoA carboxylase, carboxyltransferase subunit beta [Devosia psychrophila]|jgi:acetyl-CoA carboxylase carboxyl transferase subunit beta|uniref:Acetyl-coenzyme A carboxylase carboxyl transferase subunit beta n=1 Tax=Devosia psychrophila TaxID=728005 RepID=A0A0F5PUJ9_9HYPH|nr:acetyl-CoA carboxylase, carboxyltransferase subunit beta [Devosia psychrophila]KKC31499.1 acetyl-CoA carboxylase subunit beta [Devosia psychrophila]SFB98833.1 acetyl-CoA carboxylase carboxyl transferase subunit beta [Devosia psychrophila]
MNWIDNFVRPKIRSILGQRPDIAENLWVKDPESGEMVFYRDLEANQWVVPNSGYHMKIKPADRLKTFLDDGAYELVPVASMPVDPLKFRDQKRYPDRLKENRAKTGFDDSVIVATGKLFTRDVTVAIQDFDFMGGSLGMAAGQGIITGLETAANRKTPFVLFVASGGARMQEGVLSLMQMPRTTVAVLRLREAGLPFFVVLTNPTTGGVTASYAMLGDVHLAEPGAMIGFAGARVIEQTIREKLPKGFQRSEYLYEHGMVDMVVHRHNLRSTIGSLAAILTKVEASGALTSTAPTTARSSLRDAAAAAEGDDAGDLITAPAGAHAE